MKGSFLILVAFSLVSYISADTIDMYVEPTANDEIINLLPEISSENGTRTVTRWNLTVCEACKMHVKCGFYKQSCDDGVIIIISGAHFFHMCPEYDTMFNYPTPVNTMLLTIENVGTEMASRCELTSTKPYIGLAGEHVDSREHGLERKSKQKPTCRCGWSNKQPYRIVNGTITGVHEYPFAVRLMETESRITFCGGSIITTRMILTAAHCTYPKAFLQLSVLIGEHDITSRDDTNETVEGYVKEIIIHPGYNLATYANDISLLLLHDSITFNDMIGPVCMPTASHDLIGQYVKVMGWGRLADPSQEGEHSAVLRKVNIKVIDPDICSVVHSIQGALPSLICTYNEHKDSCYGDSGGPLVRVNPETNMFEQIALVSFGKVCASSDPAVNTDVAYYMDWIKEQIQAKAPAELCY